MANAAGMLKESIWRDKEFRALPRTAQATYAQLISQKELDRAGMQPLQVSKWAKGCDDVTAEDFIADLKILEQQRFVFVDEDSDELFIRSYMRHCEITRYPNILKNALRCATLVASEKLRYELAQELRRLRKADADRVADAIEPPNFEPESLNGSETKINPYETVPEPLNPSETLREPQGYGTGSGSVTLGSYQVGEGLDESRTDETASTPDRNAPPPDHCSKHPDGTDDPCRGCRAAREHRERWDARQPELSAQLRAEFWVAVRACPDCDSLGLTELSAGHLRRCPNHDWEAIRDA
jgi:hypothetical protein